MHDIPATLVIDPLEMLLMVLIGWLARREREALACLIEENRPLRRQMGKRHLRVTVTTDGGWPYARSGWTIGRCARWPRS